MNIESPTIFGVVNITEDSFSDGGRWLDPDAAVKHALDLVADGADVIDLGAASSHPDARAVAPEEEIARLAPVIGRLESEGVPVSVDTFEPETQRWALGRGVAYLNDIQGFPDPAVYPELARSGARLVVMHAVQPRGRATRIRTDPAKVFEGIVAFFETRLAELDRAGVRRERIILDPGMGFFLGSNPEPSLVVLRGIGRLRERFRLPVLISVSRKSFLANLTGRSTDQLLAATLAAELFAAAQGVDHVRTHDVRALRDALRVLSALRDPTDAQAQPTSPPSGGRARGRTR
jgi:dihydropteroate synthase type 2